MLKIDRSEWILLDVKTRQDKTRQDKTRQDKTIQYKTRQDTTRQDKTRQDKTRQDKTRQDKTISLFWGLKKTCRMPGVHPVAFCTIMAIARQKEARSRHYALLLPNEFLVHSTIDSTVHSRPLIYAQSRWQISDPAGIRTQKPRVLSHNRIELAIVAKNGCIQETECVQDKYRAWLVHNSYTIIDDTFIVIRFLHNQYDMLNHCWPNVGPPSATLVQL